MEKIIFNKGESISIGFLLNSEYDMNRIESCSAWVGGKKFPLATIGQMLRCEIKSTETHLLAGKYKLILWLDDSVLGIKKIEVADVEISFNHANDNNSSINEGYDFVFNITINETAIQAGDILYNYVKGDNADLPDGIVIDPNYVHTDNNYDDAAVLEVAKIQDKANSADVYTKSETYTQTEINNKLSAVYKFKGSVITYDLLPTDAENADVWNVVNGITPELNGMNYAWNSTLSAWDAIGGIVGIATLTENGLMSKEDFKKLSDLYTKEDLDLLLADKSDVGHKHSGETLTPDVVEFQTPASIPTNIGSTYYDAANKVLSTVLDGSVLQNGLELYVRVVNKTGAQINDGQAVYISGAQGNRPTATLAQANTAVGSNVIGVATQNIADNAEGFVTVFGSVDYNTTGLTDGATLYLSGTVAGALTETEPAFPLHKVCVATALNSTNNGKIFVRPFHVFELAELHGVDLTDTAPTDTDSAITKVGSVIKASTFSSIYTYIKDKLLAASHTFTQLITFSGGVKIKNSSNSANEYVIRKIIDPLNPNTDALEIVNLNNIHTRFFLGNLSNKFFSLNFRGVNSIESMPPFTGIDTFSFGYGPYSHMIGRTENTSTIRGSGGGMSSIAINLNGGPNYGDNNKLLTVLTNGNVGIDTITPETKLDINGTTTLRDWVYLNNGTHTGDAVGDRRKKVVSDVEITERCTVASATKGGGTWVQISAIDANGFDASPEYDDILPGMGWVDAAGGAAPDIVAHTIAGIAVNFKAFDGNNTTEAMTSAFEITHAIDVDALNRATTPLLAEIHTHGMAATTVSGVVKIFYDLVYQPVNAAPIAWGTFSNLITINANEQYWHKLGGVELTKPSSGYNIGDQIIVKYYRVPTDAQDTYPGDWLFKQCALHMPLNSNGSRQRYIK